MYPTPSTLTLPLEPYTVGGYHFRQKIWRRFHMPAIHLGDDVVAETDTPVVAIGDGEVLWSQVHHGSPDFRNWGGLVIVGHTNRKTGHSFFSVYGHMHHLNVDVGDTVQAGQHLGTIAPGNSPDNGWWQTPHLHFGIYRGHWHEKALPGWWRPEQLRTNLFKWEQPQEFIKKYNA